MPLQTTEILLLIRPSHFGYNSQTAESNVFQKQIESARNNELHKAALQEFDRFVSTLRSAGITVTVMPDAGSIETPDTIFPNNWVSFHDEGRVVLYPMMAENRRLERRKEIIERLQKDLNLMVNEIFDLSYFEQEGKFLEGTGSMVLDRVNKIAFACLSPRTHLEPLQKFCELMGYRAVTFTATDEAGTEIYHTNVVMSVGENISLLCLEAVEDQIEAECVKNILSENGKLIIPITRLQLKSFAGNVLQVRTQNNEHAMVMSEKAYNSLDKYQKKILSALNHIVCADLNTIETVGGGSARCMLAEIFK